MELNEIDLMKKFLELYYADSEIPIPSLEESALNGLFQTPDFLMFRKGALTALRDLADYDTQAPESRAKEDPRFDLGYLAVKTLRALRTPGLFVF